MKIACSMIALNEEQYIKNAIESIANFTDTLVLVDGGSTDNTVDLARKVCEKYNIEFIQKTKFWENDFALQRNYSLLNIPLDIDWWFRLDADETFGNMIAKNIRKVLGELPKTIEAVGIKQINLVDVDINSRELYYSAGRGGWETHPRIFRNIMLSGKQPAWQWVGQVHEYCHLITRQGLVYPQNVASWNVSVIHWGWLDTERRVDRENLYEQIPGSGFVKGSLTERNHVIKPLWKGLI